MSQNKRRTEIDFSAYDSMSDLELENILRQDIANEDSQIEPSIVMYVVKLLAKRKRDAGQIPHTPEAAFASFKENYLDAGEFIEPQKTISFPQKRKHWYRAVASIAAAVAIVFCTAFTANAFHFPFWDYFVQWATETFSFVSYDGKDSPYQTNNRTINTESEYLELHQIPCLFLPQWLPNGYVLDDMVATETPFQVEVLFIYKSEGKELRFSIKSLIEDYQEYLEQSNPDFSIYYSDEHPFYLFENHSKVQASWRTEEYEYYLSGDVSIEDVKSIIDSMEKG